ncbi:conserved hypothetical protein [Nitrosococcus halophilus Nc 4]|uniref:Secreted protein n=1 Tax=Nitrosococcus halophilus (strain Nc4) TaxID=472759 RepID=D5BUP9_NITHN|nr:hypothetical protein [Nitrosococcus halophilus]ADE13449.1 conserved hypothetical protein [Nitrosococcus halophilus Nc 4]
MDRKYGLAPLGAVLLSLGLAAPGSATGDCIPVPVKGKIFNNALGPGSTLGTVHIIFGTEKFKCGIRGDGKYRDPEDPHYEGPLNFDHTIVCDDDTGDDFPVHSQLLWDTSGEATIELEDCPNGLQSYSFWEKSWPVPGTGTGRFQGVTGGSITIEGTLFCNLAIDMEFSGELCIKAPD